MSRTFTAGVAASISALLLLPGCKGNAGGGAAAALPPFGATPLRPPSAQNFRPIDKIKHIVIVIQENRSLNNLFYGYPGAKTVTYGYESNGHKVELKPIGLSQSWDLEHNSQGFYAACDGTGKTPGTDCRMNGFNNETCDPKCPALAMYSYVPHNESAPYFSMAQQYVLADEMFASNFDTSSFVSHLYAIAGQANQTVNYPYYGKGPTDDNWGCPGVDLKDSKKNTDWVNTILKNPPRKQQGKVAPCWDTKTIADELDAKKLSWAFYAGPLGSPGQPGGETCGSGAHAGYQESGIWSTYQAIKHICYGPDWNNVFTGPPQFLRDVSKGELRNVTWITPYCRDSDHLGCNAGGGPSWVASIVNAVGESSFWDSTAIFVFWDDYGGLYDSVAPQYVDYDGLGVRVPMLIISPYAKKGHVSHVHYEHGSILKFIEDRFGLSPLAASDHRAASPESDCFDFSQSPRKFVPIGSRYDIEHFLHEAPDYRPPDTN